jgi:hypothetical protein
MKQKQIEEILKSKRKLYVAITGGGTGVLPLLLENGGASSIFFGATIPYCHDELENLIGPTNKAVSRKVALLLSTLVYNKSVIDTLEEGEECVGIGVTCSLAKAGVEREGREHNVCIAVSILTPETRVNKDYIEISLGEKRTRKQEEDLVSELILNAIDMNMCLRKANPFQLGLKAMGLTDKDKVQWEPL